MKTYDLNYSEKIFYMYQLRDIFWLAGATQKFVYIQHAWVYIACLIVLSWRFRFPATPSKKKMNILFAWLLIFAFCLSVAE